MILLTIPEFFIKVVLVNMIAILMTSAKVATPNLLKIIMF